MLHSNLGHISDTLCDVSMCIAHVLATHILQLYSCTYNTCVVYIPALHT